MNLRPLLALAFSACAAALPVTAATADKKPSIVVILTDDMGFSDIGPHSPIQAPAAEVAKYRGKYLKGWDVLRRERFEKQKALGLAGPGWSLPERPANLPAWNSLDAKAKDFEDLRMATYAPWWKHVQSKVTNPKDKNSAPNDVDPAALTMPLWLPDTPAARIDLAQYYSCVRNIDEFVGALLKKDDPTPREEVSSQRTQQVTTHSCIIPAPL